MIIGRILSRSETAFIITELMDFIGVPVNISDANGRVLVSGGGQKDNMPEYTESCAVKVEGKTIGWVNGKNGKISFIASLLSHLSVLELDKKALARETLDKYKELTLLYNIAENISACLDLKEVAKLILGEAKKLLKTTEGSIMLLNETKSLEIVSAFGLEYNPKTIVGLGEGIAGTVALRGKPEIINDVSSDPRFIPGNNKVSSLICAPLKTKDRVIGVINISNRKPVTYSSGELKLLSILASEAASAIENAILHENKIKEERIKSNLERYIAPQIVSAVMNAKDNISLKPARRHITILFSDIRKFSSLCEELLPEKIVEYLNEYFTHMVDAIFRHEGTLNKFVGDMIVALFGAPANPGDNEKRAIETAIDMQKCIRTMPDFWIRKNFNTGIGISSGQVVVGNIGSPHHMDYTAIGDEVNMAERLQSIAQGGQIFVTRQVYAATKNLFEFKDVGRIDVKGKKNSVQVYEVIY